MSFKIKGVVSAASIVLHYMGETITIQADTDRLLFEEFKALLKENNEADIIAKFVDVREKISKYTNDTFYVEEGQLFLKGDEKPIPIELARKLLALEREGEDFLPFILFWKKLKKNPDAVAIQHMYAFMEHNNIGITEFGDIVVEKGVKAKAGGSFGELVDCYTGKVDNSIGMEVSMKREHVNPDPNQTCSHGLHVGAPDYVRSWYTNRKNVIVKCIVNPADVVAIPTDYNNTKMRVCKYVVVGYSDKNDTKQIVSLSSFLTTPPDEYVEPMQEAATYEPVQGVDKKVVSKRVKLEAPKRTFNKYVKKFNKLTSQKVKDFVSEKYGIVLPHSNKSKKAIVKRASIIAANSEQSSK